MTPAPAVANDALPQTAGANPRRRGSALALRALLGLATGLGLSTIAVSSNVGAKEKAHSPVVAPEPRYVATWIDGSQATGEIVDWGRPDGRPTVDSRPLFDAQQPVRTIWEAAALDARPTTEIVESFIEFSGSDRLPGRVVGYRDGEQPATAPVGDDRKRTGPQLGRTTLGPPYLLIETPLKLDLPGYAGRTRVPVVLASVRRIVHGVARNKPVERNTLRHVDGRRTAFRALRWKEDAVELLAETGVMKVPFEEIADLELSTGDERDALLTELATLSPDLTSRLMRLDTSSGARITTSMERCRAMTTPKAKGPDGGAAWRHIVQPAWSLEPLGVECRSIRSRVFFAPNEMLLSRLRPVASRHYGAVSAAWATSRADCNVEGGPLVCGGQPVIWGVGVHGGQELEFELPKGAARFSARLGLDRAAGGGGSVVGRVAVGGKQVFTSGLLTGAMPPTAIGPLALDPRAPGRLTLLIDPAYDAPRPADPLDIRDIADWLEPLVLLDAGILAEEVARFASQAAPGLAAWSIEPPAAAGAQSAWRPATAWDDSNREAPGFRTVLELSTPITVMRRRPIAAPRDTMVLWLGVAPRGGRATFEVSVDGRRLGSQSLPSVGEWGDPRPIVLPLADYAGRAAEIAVRIEPLGRETRIDWRGATFGPAPASDVRQKPPRRTAR